MTGPLEIAIVGAGRIAAQHVRAAAGLADIRIAAVIDPDLDAAHRLAAAAGATIVGAGLDVVPPSTAGAIICSPTSLHGTQAVDLVERGIGVLVEKPLAASPVEARRLVELADARGVVALAAQVLRYLPLVDVARDVIRSGRFGRPVQVIERRLVDRADNFPWWRDVPAFLVAHWGAHSVDLVCHLFDDAVERVVCEADSVRSEFGVVDDFSMVARFASGLRMSSAMSFSSLLTTHDIVLVGTGATVSLECYRAVAVDGVEVLRLGEDDMLDAGFAAQLADFAATLRGGGSGIAQARTALPALDALAAAERSALGGRGESVAVEPRAH